MTYCYCNDIDIFGWIYKRNKHKVKWNVVMKWRS